MNNLLQDFIVEDYIKSALKEDIGYGDITTDFLTEDSDEICATLVTREEGILCGSHIFEMVFKILSPNTTVTLFFNDGDKIKAGDKIAKICGSARFLLNGERVALNYMQRMSGIATETNKYVKALENTKAKIVDTRKTTPNFRMFEKYSVICGGASLHRFNLSDCVMIKDNHIKFAGGIKNAVEKIRRYVSHAHKIEIECDTLKQVKESLEAKADIIMLDNMTLDEMKEACKIIDGKAIVEASGNVKLDTVKAIAYCGVDVISSSAIVAKAKTLDIGLDF